MSQGSSTPIFDLKRVKGTAISTNNGAADDGTLRVHLSNESLTALENISITVPGTVDLGTVSLNALESITVVDGGSSLTIDGTVELGSTSLAALETTNAVQSGTWNVTNISGTISLPTGAATSANQSTIIGHLDGVEGLLGTIDADTGSILTSVQLLDDTVATDNSAALTKCLQVGGTDGTNAQIISVTSGGLVNIADGGGSLTVDGTVAVSGSVAVTGTFWQATQPVSIAGSVAVTGPLTDTQLRASAVPVSLASVPSHAVTNAGTFVTQENGAALTALQLLDDTVATDGSTAVTKLYQVGGTDGTNAQILSVTSAGALNIADGGNSITVDGTFWQATQPVSIAATVNVADGGGSITVDGTFWQATQPVSLASVPTHAVTQSGTWTVGLSAAQTLATVTTVSTVTNLSQLGGQAIAMGTGVRTAGTQRVTIATDDSVNVNLAMTAKSNASTTAYAASLIIKNSAGTLFMLNGYNSKTSDQFIQLFDSATLPADSTAPKLTFYAPAESNFYFDFGMYGRAFTSGIVVSNSSTGPTKTIGSADCWFDAQYS